MKYLVTGGAGYVGRHVVNSLLKQGNEVIISARNEGKETFGVPVVALDVLNSGPEVYEMAGRPDILIHLAWEDGFSHLSNKHLDNLPGHINFLRNMLRGGLRHVVGLGTMHEVGYHVGPISEQTPTFPQHPYGIAKDHLRRVQEVYCREYSAISQWLRCYYIYGDDHLNNSIFAKLLQAVSEGKESFPLNSGELLFDFIHVKELGEQIATIASQKEIDGIINCCSGNPVSLKTMVHRFVEERNLDIKLDWMKFPLRAYDSRAVWGDRAKLDAVLALAAKAGL